MGEIFFFEKKSDILFQNNFSTRKNNVFRWDFFKVHLLIEENRFRAVSDRSQQFKTPKSQEKKCGAYKFKSILLSGRSMTSGCPGANMKKIEEKKFPTKNFIMKKKVLKKVFFSNIKFYISALFCATLHGQRITLRDAAYEKA